MKTEIVKIDPKEYGLEVSQVSTIEQAFLPKIQERDALAQIYEQLITSEITPDLCVKASETIKKLVKVRTGIADVHKTQKAFFLAAGRFVDAWKNKETLPVEQMEENLSLIENHYINIEKERKAKLAAEIQAQKDAEAKRIADEKAAKEAELNKGDAEKVKDLIKDLTELKSKYAFKSVKNQKMYSDLSILLDKVIEHVKK